MIAKALFLLYHFSKTATLPAPTIAGIFGYGLWLDASSTAYLSVIPFALFILGSLLAPRFPLGALVRSYTAVAGLLVALLSVADLELYRVWGFRMDATPLQYLSSPTEMAASAGSVPLPVLGLALLVLVAAGVLLYNKVVGKYRRYPLVSAADGQRWQACFIRLYWLCR
jgi:hypothetical protein